MDLDWEDETTKLACRLRRQEMGHWCGYVDVGRKMTNEEMEHLNISNIVHGGVTYCSENLVGWDAAHHGDYFKFGNGRRVWTMAAAKAETEKLAKAVKSLLNL